MNTDGIFTTHLIEIPFAKYNQPITLWAGGDIHHNSPSCDLKKFDDFLEEAKGDYFFGLGDYLDSVSTSERKALRAMALHDSTTRTLDSLYQEHVEALAKKLKAVKVLGLCGGNHYYEFPSGITTDQMLAEKLGCKYLGVNSIVRLILAYDKNHTQAVDVVLHHGKTGTTPGGSINQVAKMAMHFNADIVLQGHNHDLQIDYVNRLGLASNHRLENKKMLLARTGSFLKSYEEGKCSYAVDAGYSPSSLGAVKISLTPRRVISNREDLRWVEIRATI